MKTKVLIVGGGVVGTAVAMHAGRNRDPIAEPVALVDKTDLAAGASGRAPGIVHLRDDQLVVASMARDSLRFYESFRARTGRSVGFRRSGVLTFASGERGAALAANGAELCSTGMPMLPLDADGIRATVPGIQVPDDAIGLFEAQGGYVDPELTVESLATLARSNGTATRLGVEVQRLDIQSNRIVGVDTTEGYYETEQVVLAAGPWIAKLARMGGIDLPLRAVQLEHHFLALPKTNGEADFEGLHPEDPELAEEMWTLEDSGLRQLIDPMGEPLVPASELRKPRIPHPVIFDLDQLICIRPDPENGRIRIGRLDTKAATALEDPDDLDETVPSTARASLREAALRVLPQHSALEDLGSQANWCTLSLDNRGLVGPVPEIAGLYVASGFTNHDFHLAPSIGEGIAQMLRGEPVGAFDADYFSLDRFVTG